MKIVYCLNQLERIGGTERITIAKANALSQIEGNYVYIVVAYNRKENGSIHIGGKVILINLDVRYYADSGYNRIDGLLFYLKKRKEHRQKLESALNNISPDIVISVGGAEKQFLPKLKVTSNPVFIREMHFHKYYRRVLATGLYEKLLARVGEFIDFHYNINKYDRIVTLTEEDKKDNWKNNPKVVVIPNPITDVPKQQSSLDNKIVIAVGRLVKQKNFNSLISAWAYIAPNYPDWHLKIFGDGDMRQQLQAQIDLKNLSENITLCGLTNDIFSEMAESSIFAMSSICEGFSLAIIEAMGCGLPVVSYACPCGPKDIIEQGVNGFIVPFGEENRLADSLMAIIKNGEMRKRMGQKALATSKLYTMEILVEKWMSFFQGFSK